MEKLNITVIGAGVIGLASAAELAKKHKDVFVVESNDSFGRETSSRNSEVIHAGIYYPADSLKKKTCIEGRGLLYEYCRENNIPHKKTGKLIVAIDGGETKELEALYKHGLANGVSDLKLLSKAEAKKIEPNVVSEAAIYSPSTGIIDTHSFMDSMAVRFKKSGGEISYNTRFIRAEKADGGFKITVEDKSEGEFEFFTRVLINAAGLDSDKVSKAAGVGREDYRIKYCKGDYFRVHNNKAKMLNGLVYPVPKKDRAGLGIHATPDLAGGLRLGPDDKYISKIDYTVDPAKAKAFYDGVKKFLPFIAQEDIAPDTSGIRPKLQGEGEEFRDFIIKNEAANGLPGLINLIGIESPGLTASLSIARMVRELIID